MPKANRLGVAAFVGPVRPLLFPVLFWILTRVRHSWDSYCAATLFLFGSLERTIAAAGWPARVPPGQRQTLQHISDSHAMGVLRMATPLVLIDVSEYAFYVDYKKRKGGYVAKFVDHIEWRIVYRRFKEAS